MSETPIPAEWREALGGVDARCMLGRTPTPTVLPSMERV
jgi:hypothetical protein